MVRAARERARRARPPGRGLTRGRAPVEGLNRAITRLELLYSARSPDDYAALEGDLDAFRDLRIDGETMAIARTAQRKLGQHRVPIPDLLIAACAQQHGADVLHRDRHYDLLARVLHFGAIGA